MRNRVEILETQIKNTKVRLYGTNLFEIQKKIFLEIFSFFEFEKISN